MKTNFHLFALLFLFFSISTIAQEATLSKALLWEVADSDGKTSYLYGTIHSIPQDQFSVLPELSSALDKSQQVVLEADFSNPQLMIELQKSIVLKDNTLKDLFGDEEFTSLQQSLQEKAGGNLEMFNGIRPLYAMSGIIELTINKKQKMTGYEPYFIQEAKSRNLPLGGLETMADIMARFDQIPLEKRLEMLKETILEIENGQALMQKLTSLYLDQDIDGMHQFLVEVMTEYQEFENLLISGRNMAWLPVMEKKMQEGTIFFAVGAGHFRR